MVAYEQKNAADLNVPPNSADLMEGPGGTELGGKVVVTEGGNDCVGGLAVDEWGGGLGMNVNNYHVVEIKK